MKIKRYIFIGFAICLVLFLQFTNKRGKSSLSQEEKKHIDRIMSTLSEKERKYMREFFDSDLFHMEPFAYTLFGSKPISVAFKPSIKRTKRGWEAWKKIAPYFNSKKFAIQEYQLRGDPFIFVANLEEVEKVFYQNHKLFEKELRRHLSFEMIKQAIIDQNELFQKIMDNHLLLGILFGFGTRNAQIFTENQKLPEEKQFPLAAFTSKNLFLFFYITSKVLPPGFACDPNSQETKELRASYKTERRKIKKLAKGDGLFINMLAELKRTAE